MNDPNKVINVNLSSLLSLKAELLRKQAEVNKAKVEHAQKYTSHKPSKLTEDSDIKEDKGKRLKTLSKTKDAIVYEDVDPAMLEKSQRVLEAKAKFYERMQRTGGKLNSDDNCLVMFNKKRQEDKVDKRNEKNYSSSDSASEDDSNESKHNDDPEDEWVEYTDCLGRTRTCLKRDLAEAKRKDEQLAASMPERLDQTKANWMIDTVGSHNKEDADDKEIIGPVPPPSSVFGDDFSIMSKHEEQKANWERKEQENLEKTDVHYQDVFFDEARQHGVGYYAFSTDEEERKKQQRELEKARQQTLDEQKRRETLKEQREKIIAERVLAAKNRQRARLGLPPLEKEKLDDGNALSEDQPKESKEERKARKKAERQEKKRLKEEKKRERDRLNHIRPWDEEKEGVARKNRIDEEDEWQYKPEREPMTQEQWNEYKRNERIDEFAPTSTPVTQGNPFKRTNFKSTSLYEPVSNCNNIQPLHTDVGFSKHQSTKTTKIFKRRNCSETTQGPNNTSPSASLNSRAGVCIPPPSNLDDFHLPSHKKRPKSSSELEDSIEAGLRFLRNCCDKEMPATKSSWTAKADY